MTENARWGRTLGALRAVLHREQTVEDLLEARRAMRPPRGEVAGPPRVTVDNLLSDSHTVIEVKAPDRVGLLHAITSTFSAFGLDIGSARIATEIDHAYDTFYVTDRQGRRLEDPAARDRLRDGLGEALLKPV